MENKQRNYSPEEIAEIENRRILEMAELIKGGATYEVDQTGYRSFSLTQEQKIGKYNEMNQEIENSLLKESVQKKYGEHMIRSREELKNKKLSTQQLFVLLYNTGTDLFYIDHGIADGRYSSEGEKHDKEMSIVTAQWYNILKEIIKDKNKWTNEMLTEEYKKFIKEEDEYERQNKK